MCECAGLAFCVMAGGETTGVAMSDVCFFFIIYFPLVRFIICRNGRIVLCFLVIFSCLIQNFKVVGVPKDKTGVFYSGDAYIIYAVSGFSCESSVLKNYGKITQ